jgi:phenylalanyl-tRNA synthetase beta chain
LRHFDHFSLFEIGNIFLLPPKKTLIEWQEIAFVEVAKPKSSELAILTLKEKVVSYLQSLGIGDIEVVPLEIDEDVNFLHPTRRADITLSGVVVGTLGEVHPTIAKNFSLPEGRVAVASLRFDELAHAVRKTVTFVPLQKFPFASRDITLWFPHGVTALEARTVIKEGGGELLCESELFDIYEKDGEKSYSFHLSFGASDRTLTAEEMDVSFDTIVTLAKERFEGYIRY